MKKKKRTVADVIHALTAQRTIKAWAGFTDGKMYLRFDKIDDAKEYCIYKTRERARKDFYDVRSVLITYTVPKKPTR